MQSRLGQAGCPASRPMADLRTEESIPAPCFTAVYRCIQSRRDRARAVWRLPIGFDITFPCRSSTEQSMARGGVETASKSRMQYRGLRGWLEQVDKLGELSKVDGANWDVEMG